MRAGNGSAVPVKPESASFAWRLPLFDHLSGARG
jgi:hypothetical protein